ncbi:acylneuraminate cytidylyltransferase family protein [Desulfobacula phenolica]|uniref:N-acylneuraminate cytidylyltransferase n=1 Tax=Desulfobacula phenolica TaxID=90732 RepID=A0A1H2DS80_9BACT|nr:acylneuraminate cytidylyltransferase family protein [Desulfobacula phenolica]SDT85631.1 N-acylneuraminate cytidylyltransferase [Desulfobacula phenolica]
MFKNKKVLAIIPARGGSKGVPRKNIKLAGGKPLIAWIIEAAKKSAYIDRLVLSSDDAEIISVAREYGCEVPFVRPADFARDNSTASDVILNALDEIPGYDYVMLLQPTSPLTLTKDIDGCIEFCINTNAKSTVSVTKPGKSPYWMFNMVEGNKLKPVLGEKYLNRQRQELPDVYMPTGAVYISETQWFLKKKSFYSDSTYGYIIPRDRSLDIDSKLDFKLFEMIIQTV